MCSEFSHPLSSSPIRLPFPTQSALSGCIHACVLLQTKRGRKEGSPYIFYLLRWPTASRCLQLQHSSDLTQGEKADYFSYFYESREWKSRPISPLTWMQGNNCMCCSNQTAFSCPSRIFDLAYQRVGLMWLPRSEHAGLLSLNLAGCLFSAAGVKGVKCTWLNLRLVFVQGVCFCKLWWNSL